ncbi:hypothetical protein ES703_25091 [subsurface metagenome]
MWIGVNVAQRLSAHKIAVGDHALSVITIDADKDWQGKSITNFKQLSLIHCGGVRLEDTLTHDLCWSGIIIEGTAGENLAQFQTVYRKNDSKYWKAKADAIGTMPVVAMAVEAITADAVGKFLLFGWVRYDVWDFTVGASIYQSEATAGVGTTTQPSTSGNIVQKLGVALTADIAHFSPNYSLFEVE